MYLKGQIIFGPRVCTTSTVTHVLKMHAYATKEGLHTCLFHSEDVHLVALWLSGSVNMAVKFPT